MHIWFTCEFGWLTCYFLFCGLFHARKQDTQSTFLLKGESTINTRAAGNLLAKKKKKNQETQETQETLDAHVHTHTHTCTLFSFSLFLWTTFGGSLLKQQPVKSEATNKRLTSLSSPSISHSPSLHPSAEPAYVCVRARSSQAVAGQGHT